MTAPNTMLDVARGRGGGLRGLLAAMRRMLSRPTARVAAALLGIASVAALLAAAVPAFAWLAGAAAVAGALVVLHRRDLAFRAAMARLRRNEERFHDFASISSDWFWEQDAELRFTDVDDISGRLPDGRAARLGKRRWEVPNALMTEEQWAPHKADLAARRPFRDFRFWRVGADGKTRCFSISGKPVFDVAGNFAGYRGTGGDITVQVRAEEALRLAKEEAELANRSKSEFLANMSHELRTPLNAILGFSEVIRDQLLGPVGTPSYGDYARHIHESGEHLLQIINDLLDLSKLEAGKVELHERALSVPGLIDDCLRLVQGRADAAGVSLAGDLPAGLPELMADERLLKQVLINLLSNAVKFTPSGGRVSIQVGRAGDGGLEIAVVDSGIGMRPEDIPVALEPFRQLDGSLSRRHEGTGLGLPLAKRLTELHGGSLVIASKPRSGTTVRVLVPVERVLAMAA